MYFLIQGHSILLFSSGIGYFYLVTPVRQIKKMGFWQLEHSLCVFVWKRFYSQVNCTNSESWHKALEGLTYT